MENKRKVYFRADASPEIGYGHFIRTLALADMLRDEFECVFYTQQPTEYQVREMEKVCSFVSLPTDDSKFTVFLDFLDGSEIVVLDNYFYTSDYQLKIKNKGCKLVCIDDMHDKHYFADAVINHDLVKEKDFDKEPYTNLYLGLGYALLRKPFLQPLKEINRIKGKWTICFGGSDAHNLTTKAAKILSSRDDISMISAIVGDAFQYKEELMRIEKVEVFSRLSADEMAQQYLSSENVCCSLSSVCFESLACGCKTFAGYYVDNQKVGYEKFVNHNLVVPLGNLLETDLKVLKTKDDTTLSKINFSQVKDNFLLLFNTL